MIFSTDLFFLTKCQIIDILMQLKCNFKHQSFRIEFFHPIFFKRFMKKQLLVLFISFFAFITNNQVYAQGTCAAAQPFCTSTGVSFPASTSTTAPAGPDYGCLGSQPNPAWYYLNISTAGNIDITLTNSASVDIDFIAWGPFASQAAMCAGIFGSPPTSGFDCSFSTAATEYVNIVGATVGQWYMVLITNYSGMPTNISATQSGGAGATNCAILCNMTGLTAVPGACNPATNQFTLNGTITTSYPPTTGTLTITNSCGGSQVLNPPFATSINYSFPNLPANGAACSITATYSADPTCTLTQNYTSTAPCAVVCNISAITTNTTPCNSATQQYDVSGNVTFANAPASGTLTITNSCGGAPVVLNAPFVSSAAYNFTGLSANGGACSVTAVFSADAACTFTQNYTAPAPCLTPCSITGLTASPSACDPATNNYSVTGSVSFTNPPASGTLTISSSCGGTNQVFNAPFVSPMAYALNGIASNGAACTVTAVFSAAAGCTLTQNYTAPASCLPCPVTAGNNGPICEGQTLNLTATNLAGATYSWTGPGGFASALQNPTIPGATPAMSGTYTVTITVNTPAFCTSSSTTLVTINPNPVVVVNSPTTCSGVGVTLTANGATSYSWAPGGQITNTISVSGTSATYTVTGTTNGCSSTAIATVTTYPPPVVNIVSNVTSGCNPLLVTFTADTVGNAGATYTWNYGDGTSGTNVGYNPTHFYNTVGCHTVTLTASFGSGCTTTDSVPCMITVYPQPDANFFMSSNEADILNPTINFFDASTYSSIWLWNFGDSTSSILQNPMHTFPDVGTYPVTLYASNINGCIDSVTYYVIINDVLTIYIPNSFSPNGDGVNDVFQIHGYGISPQNFELMIFDRWGNKIFLSRDINEGWNGSVNNNGNIVQQDVYVYKVNYRDLQNRKKKIIGHVTIVK